MLLKLWIQEWVVHVDSSHIRLKRICFTSFYSPKPASSAFVLINEVGKFHEYSTRCFALPNWFWGRKAVRGPSNMIVLQIFYNLRVQSERLLLDPEFLAGALAWYFLRSSKRVCILDLRSLNSVEWIYCKSYLHANIHKFECIFKKWINLVHFVHNTHFCRFYLKHITCFVITDGGKKHFFPLTIQGKWR